MRPRNLANPRYVRRALSRNAGVASCAKGMILLDALAALGLTGVLLAAMAALVISYDRAGDHYMSHHQAQLAAESYVEHVRAGLPAIPDTDRISYHVDRQPGEGDWSGLTRLSVTAEVKSRHRRAARYTVTTYLPGDKP